jgi:hypothetical protein
VKCSPGFGSWRIISSLHGEGASYIWISSGPYAEPLFAIAVVISGSLGEMSFDPTAFATRVGIQLSPRVVAKISEAKTKLGVCEARLGEN